MDLIFQIAIWTGIILVSLMVLGLVLQGIFPQSDNEITYEVIRLVKNKNYCILQSSSPFQLERFVNAAIALGYQPSGNVSYTKNLTEPDLYAQAVVKIG